MKRAKVIISLIWVLCCSTNHDEGRLKDNLIDACAGTYTATYAGL